MSEFHGRRCDKCGREERSQRVVFQEVPGQLNMEKLPRQWMTVTWNLKHDYCPDCAIDVGRAIDFMVSLFAGRDKLAADGGAYGIPGKRSD
jgi:hypothetical protein